MGKNERRRRSVNESIVFIRNHSGLAISIGLLYYFMIFVPVDLKIFFNYTLTLSNTLELFIQLFWWILASSAPIVGIVAAEKVASDGATTIAVYTDGIFDITAAAAGGSNVGVLVAGSGTANMFTAADANDVIQNSTIGMVLEAAANDERCAVRVNK